MTEKWQRYAEKSRAAKAQFLAALERPEAAQRDVLEACLRPNESTAFGREHALSSARTVDDYRAAVPIRDYEALSPWIERAAAGEKHVLTAEDPVVFLRSSGSTGQNKKIPATRTFFDHTYLRFYYACAGNLLEFHPGVVGRADAALNLKWDPTPAHGRTASGRPHLGASQVNLGAICEDDLAPEPGSDAPWAVPGADGENYIERTYRKLRFAASSDLRLVIGINPAMVVALVEQIAQSANELIRDLHDGTTLGRGGGPRDRERAKRLGALAEHFGALRPHHLWPRFELLFLWTTGVASLYIDSLREQFGPNAAVLPAPAAASEGPVAVPVDRHRSAGPLAVDAAFYEFIRADDDVRPDSPTQLYHELEAGGLYHVVLTQPAGLYRYALGDVVRVVDFWGNVPRVEYVGRAGRVSVAGERLAEWHVVDGLRAALRAGGGRVQNVTCFPKRGASAGYVAVVEPLERWTPGEVDALARAFDAALGRANADYAAARARGALEPIEVKVAPRGAFYRQWEKAVRSGRPATQVKDQALRRDDALASELLETPARQTQPDARA